MKLYGDITKLSGYDLDPVDLIVGGSPCQDLSIAGNRSGLKGERSGLFMEMIRVIKEMRIATNFIRPRWVLWENVPGALSSGKFKGADFSVVLGEFSRLIEPNAPDVPVPSEGWRNSGVLLVTGGGALLGELSTRNSGERPSETAVQQMCSRWGRHSVAEESRLSLILEDRPRPKYYLSSTACQGILNRAKRRGKELPELLRKALEAQCA